MTVVMFQKAVLTLALPASEQSRVFPSFCDITFELADDFDKAVTTGEFKEYESALDGARRATLETLKEAVEKLDDEDWDYYPDTIEETLTRQNWVDIRQRASEVLTAFEIPLVNVPRCVEVGRSWIRNWD